jgi:hypothetical protein
MTVRTGVQVFSAERAVVHAQESFSDRGPDGEEPGLAGLSDDQLIGVIAAVRRLESRAA